MPIAVKKFKAKANKKSCKRNESDLLMLFSLLLRASTVGGIRHISHETKERVRDFYGLSQAALPSAGAICNFWTNPLYLQHVAAQHGNGAQVLRVCCRLLVMSLHQ